jgi:hypothetical protein
MTERELAGIIATLRATATSLESAVIGGQRVNTPDGEAVLLSANGLNVVVAALKEACDILLEAIPDDEVYVERKDEEKQEEPDSQEEAGEATEAAD